MKKASQSVSLFLKKLKRIGVKVGEGKVIKDNVYLLDGKTPVLVRSSKFFRDRGYYFFGLTKSVFENYGKASGAILIFICSDTNRSFIVPARVIFEERKNLSENEAQYKVIIEREGFLRFPDWSKKHPLDLRPYEEKLDLLSGTSDTEELDADAEWPAKHADVQGMLLEIGNIRGLHTYTPNPSWEFMGKPLGEIASLPVLPAMPALPPAAGRVDVLWFRDEIPTDAFEVEISTGISLGLIRLGEFTRLRTRLHVITRDDRLTFERRIVSFVFRQMINQCTHSTVKQVHDLYKMELGLDKLRREVAI